MYEASLASVLSAAPHGSVLRRTGEAAALERKTRNRGAWAVAARRRRVRRVAQQRMELYPVVR